MALDLATENAYWTGIYEPESQKLLGGLDLDGSTAWDIGAHVGFFSLLLSRRCRRVIAVEPEPENADRLRRNVELNGAAVDVVEAAVGAAPGVTWLFRAGRESHAGVQERFDAVAVQLTTLDELAVLFGFPDVIKLDVEGAELEALRGGGTVLDRRPIVFVEVHSQSLDDEVTRLLVAHGYVVQRPAPHRLLAV